VKGRALLDTNILIHREARTVVRDDIGTLFRWLDELRYEKLVHPDGDLDRVMRADLDRQGGPGIEADFGGAGRE